jgi:hypothetical protein
MMTEKRTHAMVIPWPISQGLHTWCGYRFDAPEVSEENVASAPEAVTCDGCKRAMRTALDQLSQWVPRLGTVPDGMPGVRDQDAQCELCEPGTPAGDGSCLGDGHYLCDECEHMTKDVEDEF